MSHSSITDALIIGGSHAGLSAALTLYRALHTSIIIDSHKPRNWVNTPTHLTTGSDFLAPEDMREQARAELKRHGYTTFVDAKVEKLEKVSMGADGSPQVFKATDSNGKEWVARKIVLATGAEDEFPAIEGYRECFGQRIFPCMFQFGYEQRGSERAGLLAVDELANAYFATALAEDGHKFAQNMTIYTNGAPDLANEIRQSLKTPDIVVDDRKISRLRPGSATLSETIVEFEGEEEPVAEAFIVHRPRNHVDGTLLKQLGVEMAPMGGVKVTPPFNKTSVEGVYAAGDCASMKKIIPEAMAMGAYVGCGIARELPRRITGNSIQGIVNGQA
ncbi:FAD/NAD(P)-binding domain-containing protein [Zopfia rhizophila CBS 207.26]|uniref:FAD/NAD(P)-binding domain-containing protein n=1 Tax=Zopfia rhizophila CBS 207.26 TaxID=1314779 RepID=A0A6A6DLI9_9PEZI|nr:FAD/NAD(P)-binding domain-containing protein [Zopfia rhizophila CBS 207.26]